MGEGFLKEELMEKSDIIASICSFVVFVGFVFLLFFLVMRSCNSILNNPYELGKQAGKIQKEFERGLEDGKK